MDKQVPDAVRHLWRVHWRSTKAAAGRRGRVSRDCFHGSSQEEESPLRRWKRQARTVQSQGDHNRRRFESGWWSLRHLYPESDTPRGPARWGTLGRPRLTGPSSVLLANTLTFTALIPKRRGAGGRNKNQEHQPATSCALSTFWKVERERIKISDSSLIGEEDKGWKINKRDDRKGVLFSALNVHRLFLTLEGCVVYKK